MGASATQEMSCSALCHESCAETHLRAYKLPLSPACPAAAAPRLRCSLHTLLLEAAAQACKQPPGHSRSLLGQTSPYIVLSVMALQVGVAFR